MHFLMVILCGWLVLKFWLKETQQCIFKKILILKVKRCLCLLFWDFIVNNNKGLSTGLISHNKDFVICSPKWCPSYTTSWTDTSRTSCGPMATGRQTTSTGTPLTSWPGCTMKGKQAQLTLRETIWPHRQKAFLSLRMFSSLRIFLTLSFSDSTAAIKKLSTKKIIKVSFILKYLSLQKR